MSSLCLKIKFPFNGALIKVMYVSDVQEAQSPNTIEERNKVDSNAPAVLHRSCCHPSSCSDKKERKAEPAKIPVTGTLQSGLSPHSLLSY